MILGNKISVFITAFFVAAALVLSPMAKAENQTYTPVEGPIFNYPNGGHDQEYKIISEVTKMINATPKGATIRIALSHLSRVEPTDALLAAYKRGVYVRIAMDKDEWENAKVKRLRAALGESATKPSYIVERHTHTKLFVFSETAGKKEVVFTTSSPMTKYHAQDVWNDGYTLIGNTKIYDASVKFIKAIVTKHIREFPRVSDTEKYRWFQFPANKKNYGEDFFTKVLTHIDCMGGKTVVDFPVSRWRTGRMDLVRQLDKLKNDGCQVRVTVFITDADKAVLKELYKRKIPTRIQRRPQDVPTNHTKLILISGKHFGKIVDTVYTGSANVVPVATQATPNVMLRIKNDKAIHKIYKDRADFIWDHSHPLSPKYFDSAD